MKNYENATNDELTAKLIDLLGLPKRVDSYGVYLDEGFDEDAGSCVYTKVNYCTDWNLTMPLAYKHQVDTDFIPGGISCAGVGVHHMAYDEKPLRAIVICLIKVLEEKTDEKKSKPWLKLGYARMAVSNGKCIHDVSVSKPCKNCYYEIPF